jgi:hypothetical protein
MEQKLAMPFMVFSEGLTSAVAQSMRTTLQAHSKILAKIAVEPKDCKRMKDDLDTLKCVATPDLSASSVATYCTKEQFEELEKSIAARQLAFQHLAAGADVLMEKPFDLCHEALHQFVNMVQSETPDIFKDLPDVAKAWSAYSQPAIKLLQLRCKLACQERLGAMGPLAMQLRDAHRTADVDAALRSALGEADETQTKLATDDMCKLAEAVVSHVRPAVPCLPLSFKKDDEKFDVDIDFVLFTPITAQFCHILQHAKKQTALPVDLSAIPEGSAASEEQKQAVLTWSAAVLSYDAQLKVSHDKLLDFYNQWQHVNFAAKPFLEKIVNTADKLREDSANEVINAGRIFFQVEKQALKRCLDNMAAMECNAEAIFQKMDATTKTLTLQDKETLYPCVTSPAAKDH